MTGNPIDRWFGGTSPNEYYRSWQNMFLVGVCRTCEAAMMLECILIDKYANFPSSHNIDEHDRGGTGRPKADENNVWYVYVLILRGDLPNSPRIPRFNHGWRGFVASQEDEI